MTPTTNHSEEEMNLIILDNLDNNCSDYPNVCQLKQTDVGKQRIVTRIKELILKDGYTDTMSCIAKVESEIEEYKLQS